MNEHEVFVAARNRLDRSWAQGGSSAGPTSPDVEPGGVCPYLAIVETDACKAIQDIAGTLGFESTEALFRWNDKSSRTKREVLDLFDKAIAATAPEPHVDLEVPELVA